MKLFYHLLFFLCSLTTSTAVPIYAKPGCKDICGEVRIPYPFGIGTDCSINRWYAVDCNSSTPYLSAFDSLEVLYVGMENQTVVVNVSKTSDCRNPIDLGTSPFFFSRLHNKFVVEGCGNAVILEHGSVLTGCSTTCSNDTVSSEVNTCLGINCCQAVIPRNLKSYDINFRGLGRQGGDAGCGSAFLVDEGRFSGQSVVGDRSYVPISLLWTTAESEFHMVDCCYGIARVILVLGNGTLVTSPKCLLPEPTVANPYLFEGCDHTGAEECSQCSNKGGSCDYNAIYDENRRYIETKMTCLYVHEAYNENNSSAGIILGVSISMGIPVLVAISYILYKVFKKIKAEKRRRRFFKQNGGLLLKQQQALRPSLFGKTIIFKAHELEKATNYFSEDRILGQGGQGSVYKGMLIDGKIVAVKKSKVVNETQIDQFINEVIILSQVNHRNVVKLLGCCLETEVPLLVSEFISNGTLGDFIHSETNEFQISLDMILQIATEVAGALAYLHSSTSTPIFHRDIKPENILLDDKYSAKISDFGISMFMAMDQNYMAYTRGYADPVYRLGSRYTRESDVYSFGVVLVEMLTGKRPTPGNKYLAAPFVSAMDGGGIMSMFDPKVIQEGSTDKLLAVANLAKRCLNMYRKGRPTMKQVAVEIEMIKSSEVPTTIQTGYHESTSTFMENPLFET